MLFLQCENVKVITPLKCTLVLFIYILKRKSLIQVVF